MTILTSERDSRHPAFGEESALKPKKNRKTNGKQ
jgi:dTDP-4-dehydrorhamnose 3,5-epimerase